MSLTGHLVQNTSDIKAWFSGIDDDYVIASMQSFIADAEMDFLVPDIGQDTITALITAYNADTLAGSMATLFPYVQKACVHFALMLSSASGAFRVSDSGYYVTSTTTNKPVSDKKLVMFRKAEWKAAFKALEQAIGFLEANLTDPNFADYVASTQHTQASQYFINDSVTFTTYYRKLNRSALTFRAMLDALDWSERTYLLPTLGQALFADVKANMQADTMSDAYNALLPYIQRPLALYTVAKASKTLQLDIDGTNIVINSMPAFGNSENVENQAAASPQQISTMHQEALKDAETELNRLFDYLLTNATALPLYVVPPADEQGDIDLNCNPRSGLFFV